MDSLTQLSDLIRLLIKRPEVPSMEEEGKTVQVNSIFDAQARRISRISGIQGGFSVGGGVAGDRKLLVLASKKTPCVDVDQEDRWAIDEHGRVWLLNCLIEKGNSPSVTVKDEHAYVINQLTDETSQRMILGIKRLTTETLLRTSAQQTVMIEIVSSI